MKVTVIGSHLCPDTLYALNRLSEAKAEIVKKAFFGEITPRVPASILQLHPDFTLVIDRAAASLL